MRRRLAFAAGRMTLVRLLTALLAVAPLQLVHSSSQSGTCNFPAKWEGSWFQSGVRWLVTIEGNRFSTKGRCVMSEGEKGEKFVLVDESPKGTCYRCVVIHQKHHNVLQFKESFCRPKGNLNSLCSLITGDANLFSMFRVEATPVACPFEGPLLFTYNRGHGDCKSPVSSIDSCTEKSRLLLRYQACPDIYGTESTLEELHCLAVWKEGSSWYLVGKVLHHHATSNEDSYRCFIYDKGDSGDDRADDADYRVAQSGDATCNGMFNPLEGSRTMKLYKSFAPNKCKFPPWLTSSQNWHTLDYSRSYTFHHRNMTLRISNSSVVIPHNPANGYHHSLNGATLTMGLTSDRDSGNQEIGVTCTEIKKQTADSAQLITHFTMGCQSGYMCMMFYRRDGHVIEVQTGSYTLRAEDACEPINFNMSNLPFVTLVTSSPEQQQCPYVGKFTVTGVSRGDRLTRSVSRRRTRIDNWPPNPVITHDKDIGSHLKRSRRRSSRETSDMALDPCLEEGEDFTTLVVGCNSKNTMEFHSECTSTNIVSTYSCHGGWEDNGINYLITTPLSRSSHGARRFCFMYKETEGVVHFSSSSDSCRRNINPGVGGALAFNVTNSGQCVDRNRSSTKSSPLKLLIVFSSLVYLYIFSSYHIER